MSIEDPTLHRNAGTVAPTAPAVEAALKSRRPYRPPRITAHGPMVRIALGGTPGIGDSGSAGTRRPPG